MGCCFGHYTPELGELTARVAAKFPQPQSSEIIIRSEIFTAKLIYWRKINVRGTGALVLTGDALWFTLYSPEKEIFAPLYRLSELETTNELRRPGRKTHKSGCQFLVVQFQDDMTGIDDEAVFCVTDAEGWKRDILEAAKAKLAVF